MTHLWERLVDDDRSRRRHSGHSLLGAASLCTVWRMIDHWIRAVGSIGSYVHILVTAMECGLSFGVLRWCSFCRQRVDLRVWITTIEDGLGFITISISSSRTVLTLEYSLH